MNTTQYSVTDDILQCDNLIYLLAEDKDKSATLLLQLTEANYALRIFSELNELSAALENECAAAAIVLNTSFRGDDNAGIEAISQLKQERQTLPPILFTSSDGSFTNRLAALRAGGQFFFTEPVDHQALFSALDHTLTAAKSSGSYKVLIVDDIPAQSRYYQKAINDERIDLRVLSKPMDTLNTLNHFKADVIVISLKLTTYSGLELGQVIRQHAATSHTPIIFLYDKADKSLYHKAMSSGDDTFISQSTKPEQLLESIIGRAKQANTNRQLDQQLQYKLDRSEFYHLAMDQHNIVSITDLGGRIIDINDKFCAISGYSREELMGQNHRLIKSNHHDRTFYGDMWHTIASGKIWHGDICNIAKDGREYWVNSTIVPFLDRKGEPWQYISVRTDITALRVSEQRLHHAQNLANIGSWDWNISTDELYWSERIAPLFGYPEGVLETSFENFKAAIYPDDLPKVMHAIEDCVEHGLEYNVEHRVVWPDGSVHWALESGDVIRNHKGDAIRMLGVVQDITQRKEIELGLKGAEQQQRHDNQILENIAKDAPLSDTLSLLIEQAEAVQRNRFGAVLIADPSSHYLHCVAAPSLPSSFTTALDALKIDVRQTSHPDTISSDIAIHPDWQGIRELSLNSSLFICCSRAIKSSSGRLLGLLLMYSSSPHLLDSDCASLSTDVARFAAIAIEQKQVLWSLIEAKEEADKANQAKSQFLSRISHDLRTPLTAIMGFGQLLSMDKSSPLSQRQEAHVAEINKASEHLLDLINDILNLTQIESGYIKLKLEAIDTCALITECVALIAPLAAGRDISITTPHTNLNGPPGHPLCVEADRKRLKQVLLNLLGNAVKYNRHNGSISIRCEPVGENLRILVSDTGKGLTEVQQSQLFSAFERLGAEHTAIKGSGIGLVIAKGLIENMAGAIGVESEAGKGSTFWVELPNALSSRE